MDKDPLGPSSLNRGRSRRKRITQTLRLTPGLIRAYVLLLIVTVIIVIWKHR